MKLFYRSLLIGTLIVCLSEDSEGCAGGGTGVGSTMGGSSSSGSDGSGSTSTCITGASGSHSSCLSNSANYGSTNTIASSDVLSAHNAKRSGVTPAPNTALPVLQWNSDLAKTAERWVANQCAMNHDVSASRIVPSQSWGSCVGQNLYSASGFSPTIGEAVNAWYNEISCWSYGTATATGLNAAATGCTASSMIGHFTQVVWNTTTYVGCGSVNCVNSGTTSTYIACNYGPCGNNQGSDLRYPYWTGSAS